MVFSFVLLSFSESRIQLTFDSRLAYRNKGDPVNEWKYHASSLEQRTIECHLENVCFIF